MADPFRFQVARNLRRFHTECWWRAVHRRRDRREEGEKRVRIATPMLQSAV
jgi:hypothetical protein